MCGGGWGGRAILCACVFAMLCMKMFVNFHIFCTLVYLCIVCFSLSSIVKRFEFLKALYKFPIIIIIIIRIIIYRSMDVILQSTRAQRGTL